MFNTPSVYDKTLDICNPKTMNTSSIINVKNGYTL